MKVLSFKDGTYQFVYDQEVEDIYKYSGEGKKGLKLSRLNMEISFDSINQIENEEDFYQRNPDKRPKATNSSELKPQSYSQKRNHNRLKKMKDGFLKGVAKARNVEQVIYKDLKPHQQEMYDHMELTLNKIENI